MRLRLEAGQEELVALLRQVGSEPATRVDLSLHPGHAEVRLPVRLSLGPFGQPELTVELRLAVVRLAHPELELELSTGVWPLLRLAAWLQELPAWPGVSWRLPRVLINLDEFQSSLPVAFNLTGLELKEGSLSLALDEVAWQPPPRVEPLPGAAELPAAPPPSAESAAVPPRYQDAYTRLRRRLKDHLEAGVPAPVRPAVDWLLLLPDLFALVANLVLDPRVPLRARAVLAAMAAYVAFPLDVIPDFLLPAGGLDDLALVLYGLGHLAATIPPAVVREHWRGPEDVLTLAGRGLQALDVVLPAQVLGRLQRFFRAQGTESPAPSD